MKLLKQYKVSSWIGGLQIQLQSSFFYISLYNTVILTVTFWYTAGHVIAQKYAPWVTIEVFFGVAFLFLVFVNIMDYKFMLPARMSFTNKQSFKHENPAVDKLRDVERDVKAIKKHLGVEDLGVEE